MTFPTLLGWTIKMKATLICRNILIAHLHYSTESAHVFINYCIYPKNSFQIINYVATLNLPLWNFIIVHLAVYNELAVCEQIYYKISLQFTFF